MIRLRAIVLLAIAASAASRMSAVEAVPLAKIVDGKRADAEGSRPVVDRCVTGWPMKIAGRKYDHGIGVQADTSMAILVNGAKRFTAVAGLDDSKPVAVPVSFELIADGDSLWRREMKSGQPAEKIDIDISGRRLLVLVVEDVGNTITETAGNWADAQLVVEGEMPKAAPVPGRPAQTYILTPKTAATPRINGPRVFGVRPGSPFLFTIAATGERPMTFSVEHLSEGLKLDPRTGRIIGAVAAPGSHTVTLVAKNAHGEDRKTLRIEVGEEIALTPPLGWNSWTCWEAEVDQEKVLASAKAMVTTGLANHGWVYVNIDDTWQGKRPPPSHALQPNEKFPDMAKLCNDIHALGLKTGIYSTPWNTSYGNYPGGSASNSEGTWAKFAGAKFDYSGKTKPFAIDEYSFAEVDAKQWADWGIDYLKYDWGPNEIPETEQMAKALRASKRDIVYSLSNTAPMRNAPGLSKLANAWRTTGDIRDTWVSVKTIGFQQEKWREFARPGHWNDPDTLVVGKNGRPWGPLMMPTRLTPHEQYTQVSLWSLLSAPILIGCPLDDIDEFTLNLLTNDEVLEIDQDELGNQATQMLIDGRKQVWVKELADGSRAIGLFNLAAIPQQVSISWEKAGIKHPQRVRDVWRQVDRQVAPDGYAESVPRHGVVLIRVWPAAP